MLGGDHGKLKHGPPEGHSPVSESLMPKERLRIEPCFHLGNVPKGLVCGPAEVRGDTAFVPKPVDTSHVSNHRNKSIRIGLAGGTANGGNTPIPYRKIMETNRE